MRIAARLGRAAPQRKRHPRLPALFFVTDPDRTPDPAAIAARLPKGTGVIFRGFGRPGAEGTARALAAVARRRGLVLLIGADEGMAMRVRAAGVHLPERHLARARLIRARHPHWLINAAAHSPRALAACGRVGVDAALVSSIFASDSPSAGSPLGVTRLSWMTRQAHTPVIALGGVDRATARRLTGSRAAGVAAVGAFASCLICKSLIPAFGYDQAAIG